MKQGSLLKVNNLVVEFSMPRQRKIHAVSGVSLDLNIGETLGLVGESGCGKSTIARSIVGLQKPTAGKVLYRDKDLSRCTSRQQKSVRFQLQMIFQDAVASLNPGRKIGKTIEEPLRVIGKTNRKERYQLARKMMHSVGLDPDRMYRRYPFELSGGQCQRVSIARALILEPHLLICDEPVSSLDVSVQAQILNLLEKMKRDFDLTMLFISHDMAVVKNISDRVAVMYLGKLCEISKAEELYQAPRHPYTALLLASIPEAHSDKLINKTGYKEQDLPSPASPPSGCRFHTRCPEAKNICRTVEPELKQTGNNAQVACHYPLH